MKKKRFSIGQKVYFKSIYGGGYLMTVASVGRKWGRLCGPPGYRFDLETGHVDGGVYASPGQVYLSKDEYQEAVELRNMWADFRRAVNLTPLPDSGVSKDDIMKAAESLGLKLKGE